MCSETSTLQVQVESETDVPIEKKHETHTNPPSYKDILNIFYHQTKSQSHIDSKKTSIFSRDFLISSRFPGIKQNLDPAEVNGIFESFKGRS